MKRMAKTVLILLQGEDEDSPDNDRLDFHTILTTISFLEPSDYADRSAF